MAYEKDYRYGGEHYSKPQAKDIFPSLREETIYPGDQVGGAGKYYDEILHLLESRPREKKIHKNPYLESDKPYPDPDRPSLKDYLRKLTVDTFPVGDTGTVDHRYAQRLSQLSVPVASESGVRTEWEGFSTRTDIRRQIISMCNNPDINSLQERQQLRRSFLLGIREYTEDNSARIIAQARQHGDAIDLDEAIVGSGVHGVNTALVRSGRGRRVAMFEQGNYGGNFADIGIDGEGFDLNSPDENITDESRHDFGYVPGENGNPNDVGDAISQGLIQPKDIKFRGKRSDRPNSWDMAASIMVDGLVAPTVKLRITKIERTYSIGTDRKLVATAIPTSGDTTPIRIYADKFFLPTGTGEEDPGVELRDPITKAIVQEEKEKFEQGGDPKFLTVKQLFPYLQGLDPEKRKELAQDILDRGVGIIGIAGDSGRIAAQKIIELVKDNFPDVDLLDNQAPWGGIITGYGADFETQQEYVERYGNGDRRQVFQRYKELIQYYPTTQGDFSATIYPVRERASTLSRARNGNIHVRDRQSGIESCALVISSAGFSNKVREMIPDFSLRPLIDPDLGPTGIQSEDGSIIIVGPASERMLSPQEKYGLATPDRQRRRPQSMAVLTPRTMKAARQADLH